MECHVRDCTYMTGNEEHLSNVCYWCRYILNQYVLVYLKNSWLNTKKIKPHVMRAYELFLYKRGSTELLINDIETRICLLTFHLADSSLLQHLSDNTLFFPALPSLDSYNPCNYLLQKPPNFCLLYSLGCHSDLKIRCSFHFRQSSQTLVQS